MAHCWSPRPRGDGHVAQGLLIVHHQTACAFTSLANTYAARRVVSFVGFDDLAIGVDDDPELAVWVETPRRNGKKKIDRTTRPECRSRLIHCSVAGEIHLRQRRSRTNCALILDGDDYGDD
jgi:hypothetical protein